MADRFRHSVDINAPVAECFDRYCRFEDFPRFMEHVNSVQRQGDERWHWVVDGPLGKKLEWDAVIDGFEKNKLISWHSVSDPDVGVQGAAVFDELTPNTCRLTVTMQYEAPAGGLGELVASIFANPQQMVEKDLENFKRLVESEGRGKADLGEEGRIRQDIYTGGTTVGGNAPEEKKVFADNIPNKDQYDAENRPDIDREDRGTTLY